QVSQMRIAHPKVIRTMKGTRRKLQPKKTPKMPHYPIYPKWVDRFITPKMTGMKPIYPKWVTRLPRMGCLISAAWVNQYQRVTKDLQQRLSLSQARVNKQHR